MDIGLNFSCSDNINSLEFFQQVENFKLIEI